MTTRAADSYKEIAKHLDDLRIREKIVREHLCAIKIGRQVSECWCYLAGPNGCSLPCPAKDECYEGCGLQEAAIG